ncbi:Protein of unknown function DUF674 [Dillenia turbinata]|uniref:Uncharacterized protein n=1 Tax=Dillenia turbinata TaxID=194707 RepID=A0AAN8VTP9_9MAGN
MAQTKLELKLLIHPKSRKVLFAEAGKDFVDFLCSLLILPFGTVIRLLSKSMTGSFGALYDSIENSSETYMQPNLDKGILLKPKASFSASGAPQLLTDVESSSMKFYACINHRYMADNNQILTKQLFLLGGNIKSEPIQLVLNPQKARAQIHSEDHVLRTLLNFNQKQGNNSKVINYSALSNSAAGREITKVISKARSTSQHR